MFALVSAPIAPLSMKPESRAERADEVLCGMKVEVLSQDADYVQVRTHYGYEGWVKKECLCADDTLVTEWDAAAKKTVLHAYIDVQDQSKVQGHILRSLPRGSIVRPLESDTSGWAPVRLCDGTEGFVWGPFLAECITSWDPSHEEQLRAALVQTAKLYLGTQYRWGGKTPLGIDCSGLCSMAYLLNGVIIHRDASIDPRFCMHEISLAQAKAGDLLFFPGHVAMLIGGEQYIHSTAGNWNHGVVINSLNPSAPDYRADLPAKITQVGSIF